MFIGLGHFHKVSPEYDSLVKLSGHHQTFGNLRGFGLGRAEIQAQLGGLPLGLVRR